MTLQRILKEVHHLPFRSEQTRYLVKKELTKALKNESDNLHLITGDICSNDEIVFLLDIFKDGEWQGIMNIRGTVLNDVYSRSDYTHKFVIKTDRGICEFSAKKVYKYATVCLNYKRTNRHMTLKEKHNRGAKARSKHGQYTSFNSNKKEILCGTQVL